MKEIELSIAILKDIENNSWSKWYIELNLIPAFELEPP